MMEVEGILRSMLALSAKNYTVHSDARFELLFNLAAMEIENGEEVGYGY